MWYGLIFVLPLGLPVRLSLAHVAEWVRGISLPNGEE